MKYRRALLTIMVGGVFLFGLMGSAGAEQERSESSSLHGKEMDIPFPLGTIAFIWWQCLPGRCSSRMERAPCTPGLLSAPPPWRGI